MVLSAVIIEEIQAGLALRDALLREGATNKEVDRIATSPELAWAVVKLLTAGRPRRRTESVKQFQPPLPLDPSTPLIDLDFPSWRILERYYIVTLEDLTFVRDTDIAMMHGIGEKALDKIQAALAQYGLRLRENPETIKDVLQNQHQDVEQAPSRYLHLAFKVQTFQNRNYNFSEAQRILNDHDTIQSFVDHYDEYSSMTWARCKSSQMQVIFAMYIFALQVLKVTPSK